MRNSESHAGWAIVIGVLLVFIGIVAAIAAAVYFFTR